MSAAPGRHPWWMGGAAWLGAGGLALLGRTWRIERLGGVERDAALARGEGCVYALWHSHLLALAWIHRGRGAGVLISRHRDGELIARVVQRLGYRTPRGSSTRGAGAGTLEMLRVAGTGRELAVTPDGPRGPAERAKDGVIWLASRSGLPLVPAGAASHPEWRLRTWDRFRVPPPFARVVVGYGEPMHVPPGVDAAALARWRATLEERMAELHRGLEARARGEA